MGLRAKLAGLIQTNGPGSPPPGVLSCTGKLIPESTRFPVRLIEVCCLGLIFDLNFLGLKCLKSRLLGVLAILVMLWIGESGKDFNWLS